MAEIHLSTEIKTKYVEIIPVLQGKGKKCSIVLLGRRRDDPTKVTKIFSRPWIEGEPVSIVWDRLGPQEVT